jgi:hypothetical protein
MCFKKEGLLDEARLQSTYVRALRLLGNAAVVIPDEIKEEEDLGAIEDEEVHEVAAVLDETSFFDIGIEGDKEGDSSDDDDEEDDDEEEEIVVPIIQKRQRTANAMIGGVRKGKYSIC